MILIKNRLLFEIWLVLLLPCAALAAADAREGLESAQAPSSWSFDIAPYLWLAGYEGTVGLPSGTLGSRQLASETSSSFATHISAGAMLAAQIRYRNLGLFLDGAWVQLKTEGTYDSDLYSGADLKSDIAYGTTALSYKLPLPDRFTADLLAGARIWYVGNEIDFIAGTAPAAEAEGSRTWVDPIVGAQVRYDLTRHWFVTVLGDAGGFGVGSDLAWNVFGGVGYRFTDWLSATIGYRYMHVDYDQDHFLTNVDLQGALLGVRFHF